MRKVEDSLVLDLPVHPGVGPREGEEPQQAPSPVSRARQQQEVHPPLRDDQRQQPRGDPQQQDKEEVHRDEARGGVTPIGGEGVEEGVRRVEPVGEDGPTEGAADGGGRKEDGGGTGHCGI